MKIAANGTSVSFDRMVWPLPSSERAVDAEWRLRHMPGALTREDQLLAASIMSAYRQMVSDTEIKRRTVIRTMRAAQRT